MTSAIEPGSNDDAQLDGNASEGSTKGQPDDASKGQAQKEGHQDADRRSAAEQHQTLNLDQGLGSWIRRNIPDPRVRLLLLVILALLLLSNFIIRISSPGNVIIALGTLLLVAYASLVVITAAVAVYPQDGTKKGAAAQRNARGSLILLALISVSLALLVRYILTPVLV
jgi:hypothetical protein